MILTAEPVSPTLPVLRFVTAGSVDDGKSTLIGRLLFDAKGIFEDQLRGVESASARHGSTGGEIDLALVTDGLKAEREQGITIDVAYRYFATPTRKFIIADSPGHEQYTRNMATGASTADAAILLIDATQGVLEQTRRHAFILALLGIGHFAVAINKMDRIHWNENRFDEIVTQFESLRVQLTEARITAAPAVTYLPVSALTGRNVTNRPSEEGWYEGPTLLEWLETVDPEPEREDEPLRLPIQLVARPDSAFRGYMGSLAGGVVRAGDEVVVLPTGIRSKVREVYDSEGRVDGAAAPQAVTITLETQLDAGRGDVITAVDMPARVARRLEATIVWFASQPLEAGRTLRLKHLTRQTNVVIRRLSHRIDVNSMQQRPADSLSLNEVGQCLVETHQPLVFDPYAQNRRTGGFILIDRATNNTVAAGMILGEAAGPIGGDTDGSGVVSPGERAARLDQKPAFLQIIGGDEPRRSAILTALDRRLFDLGYVAVVLDDRVSSGQDAAKALLAAGLIVVQSKETDSAGGIVGMTYRLDDAAAEPKEAAEAILRALQPKIRLVGSPSDWSI